MNLDSRPARPPRLSAARCAPRLALVALTAVSLAACGSGRSSGGTRAGAVEVSEPAGGYGAESAESAITRFLDAAQAENYQGMWAVFGTAEGPAIERFGVQETESRMIILARLLKHDGYDLRLANLAGLGARRNRYEVRMTGTRKGSVMVPFVTAQDDRGRWYVEQLQADRLSGGS